VLDARYHRDHFGADYVRALASAVGLLVLDYDAASDGVDLGLRRPGRVGHTMSPGIDVRVRSSSESRQMGSEWYFDELTEIQFNQLAGSDFLYPRFLFLVRVPDDPSEFATVQTDGMVLHQLGYYHSLEQETKIYDADVARCRPVRVPLSNVLTDRTLGALIEHAVTGSGRVR
jgi:hypothetical protein